MERSKLITTFVIIFSIVLLVNCSPTKESREEKIINSAKELVNRWNEFLSKDVSLLSYDIIDGYFYVVKPALFTPPGYDIKKTDSLVNPYKLTIKFKSIFSDNRESPNANVISKGKKKRRGFKTAEDALIHTKETDFTEKKFYDSDLPKFWDMELIYVYEKVVGKPSWLLKDFNENFSNWLADPITREDNKDLVKSLLCNSI